MLEKFKYMNNDEIDILLKLFDTYFSIKDGSESVDRLYEDLKNEKRARERLNE